MKYIKIPNFEEFQHYKTRNPVWFKLYPSRILRSYKLGQLSDTERWCWVNLLMLAVLNDNKIPLDWPYLRQNTLLKSKNKIPRMIERMAQLRLIELVDASKVLAKRYQGASKMLALKEKRREENIREEKISYKNNNNLQHIGEFIRGIWTPKK